MDETNTITIVGNLVEDPIVRTTHSGKQVCNLRIAWEDRNGSNHYFTAVCWEDLADKCRDFHKSLTIQAQGRLVNRTSDVNGQTRTFTEIVAESVERCRIDRKATVGV